MSTNTHNETLMGYSLAHMHLVDNSSDCEHISSYIITDM